jgi:spore coat polysaccharide biosynthesis protein SpsF
MRLVGVIQARMGSTRLPGKVMMPLAGQPVIWHIFDRLRRVRPIEVVVLATTTDPRNDGMVRFAEAAGMDVCRHDEEEDIAGRLALVVAATQADAILKVNADCPAIDPAVLQQIADRFLAEPDTDAASNKQPFTWPLGMSAEALSARAIVWCDLNLRAPQDRELVASWILGHHELFRIVSVTTESHYGVGDLMLDSETDYKEMAHLFDTLYRPNRVFGIEAIAALYSKAPVVRG